MQRLQVGVNRTPHRLVVHSEILVGQPVSHPYNCWPGNLGAGVPNTSWELSCRFPDNFQLLDNGQLRLPVPVKLFECQAFDEVETFLAGGGDVTQ